MRVIVRVAAPGGKVQPYDGDRLLCRPVHYEDENGSQVDGFAVQATATTKWRSRNLATDRAGVVALGIIDLVLRWPFSDVDLSIEINGEAARRTRNISGWQPYEWLQVFNWRGHLPTGVATLSAEAFGRIEKLWCSAVGAHPATLEHVLGALAQASSAAAATHSFDRVVPLWSGLELLHPRMGDLKRISAIVGTDSSFAQVEEARGSKVCQQLLSYRSGLARDPWVHPPYRTALSAKPSTAQERVRVATIVAYVIRSKLAHGQWARVRDDRRPEAGAAERWLWQLLEREVEIRLTGSRLEAIRAIGQSNFGG